MFTGLVEATGQVISLERMGEQARLTLEIPFGEELAIGESVAVNGCCLTVATRNGRNASFDILEQTLKVTSLGEASEGRAVNLERALALGDRLGGHLVQGHVDATGKILGLSRHGQDHCLVVSLPPGIERYCLPKGSICVDGMSLTAAELEKNRTAIYITPHTFEITNLREARVGQTVNLEADLLAKYVERLFPGKKEDR